jgi:hypothetical protein
MQARQRTAARRVVRIWPVALLLVLEAMLPPRASPQTKFGATQAYEFTGEHTSLRSRLAPLGRM